jgi:nicotinate-nucleotide adenylyltransferase
MNIGLFGGTFDPIHFGHLRSALEVKETFGLEEIRFIPAAIPPHKETEDVADARDRLEMTRIAVEGFPGFRVCDAELRREGPSYTVDTLEHFNSVFPESKGICLIVGLDAFLQIDTWKSYRALFEMVPFIVVARPYARSYDYGERLQDLTRFLQTRISKDFRFQQESSCFIREAGHPVHVFEGSLLEISSTKIRKMVRTGKAIDFLLPDGVVNYIRNRGLYR